MSNHTDSPSDLTRRTLLRRTATAGLLALPAAGLLSACVSSGDDKPTDQATGTVTAENPLGIPTDILCWREHLQLCRGLGRPYHLVMERVDGALPASAIGRGRDHSYPLMADATVERLIGESPEALGIGRAVALSGCRGCRLGGAGL